MMKKAYARGGMQKKGYAAGGASMKKKMMSRGGKMPMNPATGKPTFVGDGIGKMAKGGASAMYKKGYAAGGAMMKKKMMAPGGLTSSYDTADRAYPGAGKKRTSTATAKKKKPVVTKAMMTKAGVTSLRDFYNKMEVNTAGTGYKKRSKALTKRGSSAKPTKKTSSSYFGIEDRKYPGSGRKPRGTTTTSKKSKSKKSPGAQGFKGLQKFLSGRGGFR